LYSSRCYDEVRSEKAIEFPGEAGLREEVRAGCCGLYIGGCFDEWSWKSFIEVYGAVVEGGSLTVKGQKKQLRAVDKVVFTKAMGSGPFTVKWTICLKDGRALVVE
jgi:hypothetical protein